MRHFVLLAVLLAAAACVGPPNAAHSRFQPKPTRAQKGLLALPLGARSPVSAALGAADGGYRIHRSPAAELYALNAAQRLDIRFGGAAVTLKTADGWTSLGSRYRSGEPTSRDNRVSYRRGPVTEWYANGPLGLEQGFTVAWAFQNTRELSLSSRLSGSLRPVAVRGGSALWFEDPHGRRVLAYDGLVASDARGRRLAASLSVRGRSLVLRIHVRGARYPVQVDPLIQSAELTASDAANGDQLGDSVAISGGTIVVGVPQHTVAGHAGQGALYVFTAAAGGGWQTAHQTAELTASDGSIGDGLGYSVGISGSTIVAGAPGRGSGGAAYVFTRPGSGRWVNAAQTAKLTGSDTAPGDQFGQSVGVSGSTIVAGAPEHSVGSSGGQGSVYVFTSSAAGRWAQAAELTASDGAAGDELGWAVAVGAGTIVATAPGHAFFGNLDQGAVYEYSEPSGGWRDASQNAELIASDGQSADGLGDSVAISGSTIAAGSSMHTVGSNSQQGAVYVFSEPSAGGWRNAVQTAELVASDGAPGDGLGYSVAIDGATIVAGAPERAVSGVAAAGAIYAFAEPSTGWRNSSQAAEASAADGAGGDEFGYAIATSSPVILVGAPGHGGSTGAAYVFGAPAPPPAPVVRAFTQSHQIWREGSRLAVITRAHSPKLPVGTTFSFNLNVQALVVLAFTQRLTGREVRSRCVALTSRNRGRRTCVRNVSQGAIVLGGHPGINRISFDGLTSRSHKLPVGQYTVKLVAAASGKSSQPKTLGFEIAPLSSTAPSRG